MKKYNLVFDDDTIFIETNNSEDFRNELIELLDVNYILSYETLSKIDINILITITQIEMTCEIKITEDFINESFGIIRWYTINR